MRAEPRDIHSMPSVAPPDDDANSFLEELLAAKRAGHIDAVERLGPVVMANGEAAMARAQAPKPTPPTLPPEHIDEGKKVLAELNRACPDAAADERLLHRLVAGEIPLILTLQQIERELAARMLRCLDDAKFSIALGRVLRDTIGLSSTLTRRVEGGLSTAASLRAQRRFLERGSR